jgi:hypothetical protein
MTNPITTTSQSPDEIRAEIRAHDGAIARAGAPGCCGGGVPGGSARLGDTASERDAVPSGGGPERVSAWIELDARSHVIDLVPRPRPACRPPARDATVHRAIRRS